MPQLALLVPATQQTAHFTSSLASVQAGCLPPSHTGTVAPTDVFFLAYTPVMTPTEHTLAPPAGLRFGNFEFHLTTYLNATSLHDIHFAQPILPDHPL